MSVVAEVTRIQRQLIILSFPDVTNKGEALLGLLDELRALPIDEEILSTTRIGRTLNKLRKRTADSTVKIHCRKLILAWKRQLVPPVQMSCNKEDDNKENQEVRGLAAAAGDHSNVPSVAPLGPTKVSLNVRIECRKILKKKNENDTTKKKKSDK